MGQDRIGRPAVVDSYRPGAFAMLPFATESRRSTQEAAEAERAEKTLNAARPSRPACGLGVRMSCRRLRRCRHPVPARVAVAGGRPVRVTTDRRGFAGGTRAAVRRPVADVRGVVGSAVRQAGRTGTDQVRGIATSGTSRSATARSIASFGIAVTDGWFIDAIVD